MSIPARHIIQRQTVWVDQPFLAFGVQERLSAYCRYQLPGLLESLFDRVADAHTVIRLDTLAVDVGTLPLADFENQLTQQISQQLEQELNRLLNNPQPSDGRVERYSRAEVMGQQVYFFLQHGYLPPWADAAALEQISDWLLSAESTSFRRTLVALLPGNPSIVSRLIAHTRDEALMTLCYPATKSAWVGELSRLFDCLHQQIGQLSRTVIRDRYWSAIFRSMETKGLTDTPTHESIIVAFYRSLYRLAGGLSTDVASHAFFQKLSKAVRQGTQTMPANEQKAFIQSLQRLTNQSKRPKTDYGNGTNPPDDSPAREDESPVSTKQSTEDIQPIQPEDQSTNQPIAQPGPGNEAGPIFDPSVEIDPGETAYADRAKLKPLPLSSSHDPQRTVHSDEGEEIYVPLAGIVLLHPFLSILFTELTLIENRAWISLEASVKGAQVLAYLATGANHCPEYTLPLIKLLCGLPFETFVSPEITLTDTEKRATAEVLEAIISHWQALGNTSPAGLRESFLQREGKLTAVDGGWRLTVERKTIDILLDRLPWGFSMIKLPWMPDLLFVDWV